MTKRVIIFLIIISIFFGSVFLFWDDILDFYSKLSLNLPQIEKEITDLIQEVEKHISIPPPLKAVEESPESFLTKAGIIQWTNIQRQKNGLSPLKENSKLNTSARLKTEDMFEKQYFAHYSPSGEGVGDLVESVGYEFIAIGENLAMGNFKDDEELVQRWMDSQGHRENILNPNYQEIGVAVLRDTFERKTTWIAVQHFGKSLSACNLPDENLKAEIDIKQKQLEILQKTINLLQIQIRDIRPKKGSLYEQLINQYNDLVNQHNALLKEVEILINKYNIEVKIFNECLTVK